MDKDYEVFENWLDNCLKNDPIDNAIIAIYFGLFETGCGIKLYISGSSIFTADDSDWACNNDYNPSEKYCYSIRILNEIFESKGDIFIRIGKIYNVILDFINKYISKNQEVFYSKRIAVGFDDGDLKIIK